MKGKTLGIVALIICIVACSKDKFQTKPQIKIKSINSSVIPVNGQLAITLEFTDKEGDLGNDSLLSIRKRLNLNPLPGGTAGVDTIYNTIPEFPDKNKGEITLRFNWNYLHQSDVENDTISFKLVAMDRGGNSSDTITTEKIVILKN
jgi:hypothetical protein